MSEVQGESVTKNKLTKEQLESIQNDLRNSTLFKPYRKGWEHITEEEQMKLREKNKELRNKRRFECEGVCEDKSDRCDFYDPYPCSCVCTKYDGEYVECITYCTWRTIKGKRINNSINPLYMERLPRWMEFLNEKGMFESCHNDFYNPEGRRDP